MKFNDALRAMAKGHTIRQPGRDPGITLIALTIPILTTGIVTPDGDDTIRNNWIMCRVIVSSADPLQRPTAFTDEEIAANNWELAT